MMSRYSSSREDSGHESRISRFHPWHPNSAAVVVATVLAVGLLQGESASADSEDQEPDYARSGWYGGVGGIFAISNYSVTTNDLGVAPPEPAGTDPDFGNTFGVDARVGYRAWDHWAFELDYQWQAGFDSQKGSIHPDLEIDTHLLSLNTKLFALTGRWQPYALLGASFLVVNTEIVDDDFKKPWDIDYLFAARFGAGVDFYIDEHWALNLEGTYVLPAGELDADMASVGLGFQYRF